MCSSCEACKSTTDQPGQTASSQASDHTGARYETLGRDDTIVEATHGKLSPCEVCKPTTDEPGQNAGSQGTDQTGARHESHTIPEAKYVGDSGIVKVVLVLLLELITIRGNVWVTVSGMVGLVLWYGLKAFRRGSDDSTECQNENS